MRDEAQRMLDSARLQHEQAVAKAQAEMMARVHAEQKTSQAIHTTGAEEMRRIRRRFHGERPDEHEMINQQARHARFWGAVTARLHAVGIRW